MSKLIVDDIELASGELLSLPASIPNNEIIQVSNNTLSAGGALPNANHYLLHDFADGQPTTISHTFVNDSSNLAAIRIMFSNLVVTASTSSTDVYYALGDANVDTTQTNPNGITGLNLRYCMTGIENNNGTYSNTTTAQAPNQRALTMFPRVGGTYLQQSDVRNYLESHTHYILFDKNSNGKYVYRMMGESIKTVASGTETRQYRYSAHWDSSTNSNSTDYIPASPTPFTNIEFNIPSNITFYAGKISIMEYVR